MGSDKSMRQCNTFGDLLNSNQEFDCELIIGDVDMSASFVWGEESYITPYGYNCFKPLMECSYEILDNGNISIYEGDEMMGENFSLACAGYIVSSEFDKMFTKAATIKANKKTLNSLIGWSSSKFNDMKKSQVIEDIIFRIEKGENCNVEYRSGVYSEGAHYGKFKCKWTGGSYTLEIKNGTAILLNSVYDWIPEKLEIVKFENPSDLKLFKPAKRIKHLVEKYGVPIGIFEVIDQDVNSFHVKYCDSIRHLAKNECEIIE